MQDGSGRRRFSWIPPLAWYDRLNLCRVRPLPKVALAYHASTAARQALRVLVRLALPLPASGRLRP